MIEQQWLEAWREFAGSLLAQEERWREQKWQETPAEWARPVDPGTMTPLLAQRWAERELQQIAKDHGVEHPMILYRLQVTADWTRQQLYLEVVKPDGSKSSLTRVLREAEDALVAAMQTRRYEAQARIGTWPFPDGRFPGDNG